MKFKFAKAGIKFLKSFTRVSVNNTDYYYMPYWYRDNKDGTMEQIKFENLQLQEVFHKLSC